MLQIKNIIDLVKGFRFIIESLDLKSSLGRRHLLSLPFITDPKILVSEFNTIADFINADSDIIDTISIKLSQIRDIQGTIKNLNNAATLDDIELFEIKHFSLLACEIKKLLEKLKIKTIVLPYLDELVNILDPEKQRLAHFYIYSLYSDELASLRHKYNMQKEEKSELAEATRLKSIEKEDEIRQRLSIQLFEYANSLFVALEQIAYLDVVIAKAKLAETLNLCKPKIASDTSIYKSLFNPQVKEILQKENKQFQAIDITLYRSPCLITGANMGGKTVLLKTVALAQYMFQFGFYIPAAKADIVPVDLVMLSMSDEQSELNGLSSYAAEILNLNDIINAIKSDKKVLVLIDELARTTNPEEGKAIVNATLDIFEIYKVRSLITSHYSGLKTNCRKLKVKGLDLKTIKDIITVENINKFMDYSLEENKLDEKSNEALNIAKILGVDNELILNAEKYLC
ncbi:MAG: DNA mismatch repair protein MutS [Bacteroidota bacterium]